MPEKNNDTVDVRSPAYGRMSAHWPMVDALDGGTSAMWNAGTAFLPKEPKEQAAKWEFRRDRSWLFGAFRSTLNDFAGMPFRRPVVIKNREVLPERVGWVERDADLKGRTLTQFGATCLRSAIKYGVTHILPEFPSGVAGLSRGDQDRLDVRPYLTHVTAKDLFGFRRERTIAGTQRIASFRVHETVEVPEGLYGTKLREEIRVYNLRYDDDRADREAVLSIVSDAQLSGSMSSVVGMPGTVETWVQEEDDDDYSLWSVSPYSFVGYPLVSIYTHRTGLLEGSPALQELAEKNVEHWQCASDQSNLVRIARVPILFRRGVSQEEIDKGVTIGPTVVISTKNENADMRFVEHTGEAIGAGRQNILDIEEQMEVLKLRPRMKDSGDPKATIAAIGENRGNSAMEQWALDTAQGLRQAFENLLQFDAGEGQAPMELPDDFSIEIETRNLVLDEAASNRIKNLIEMRKNREIDRQTFLEEVRQYGGLSEETDVEQIIQRLEQESEDELDKLFRTREAQGDDPEQDEPGNVINGPGAA